MKLEKWILILHENNILNDGEVMFLFTAINHGVINRPTVDETTPECFVDRCFHWDGSIGKFVANKIHFYSRSDFEMLHHKIRRDYSLRKLFQKNKGEP